VIDCWRPSTRRVALVLLAAALAACASAPKEPPPAGDTLSGRLSVKVDATTTAPGQSVSAGFELQGTPVAGQLGLSTPIGTMLAQARWNERQAWLTTTQGETRYDNLDQLTRDMLGESLPIAALFDWLRGRPWPGAPSHMKAGGFSQLGWAVDLARFNEGWVQAQRAQAPTVTVRALMDQP
jgi:outer membrane lipoprotein LolB